MSTPDLITDIQPKPHSKKRPSTETKEPEVETCQLIPAALYSNTPHPCSDFLLSGCGCESNLRNTCEFNNGLWKCLMAEELISLALVFWSSLDALIKMQNVVLLFIYVFSLGLAWHLQLQVTENASKWCHFLCARLVININKRGKRNLW